MSLKAGFTVKIASELEVNAFITKAKETFSGEVSAEGEISKSNERAAANEISSMTDSNQG